MVIRFCILIQFCYSWLHAQCYTREDWACKTLFSVQVADWKTMKIGPVVRVPVVTSNLVIHCQPRFAAKDFKICCSRSLICKAEVTSGGRIEGEYGTSVMPGKDETTAKDHENGAGQNSDSKASDPESSKPDVTSGGRIEGNYRTSAMPGKDDTTAVDHGNVSQMTDETKIVRSSTLCFACICLPLLVLSLLSTCAFPLRV